MSTDGDASPVPDIVLERYRLGELPRHDVEHVERRLALDPLLRARVEALDASDADIRLRHSCERLSEAIRCRLAAGQGSPGGRSTRPPRQRGFFVAWAAPAAAAVLVTALMVLARTHDRTVVGPLEQVTTDSGDRIKGLQPSLAVYRRTADGSETLADGATAHAGDVIRVGYRSAGKGFGVIFSIDGRGSVTVHLPHDGTRAAPLKSEPTVLLDEAYELDDAPRWERFYFVTADEAFEIAPILTAARLAATGNVPAPTALALSRAFNQTTFSLQKEARP